MEEKKLITIVEKDGTESQIEYVTEFEMNGGHYLIYKNPEESNEDEEVNCFFAKINTINNGYVIDDIDSDSEYQSVLTRVSEIINGGAE